MSDLIDRLSRQKGKMSKAHQKIAEYIMEKPEDVCNMSILELAEACGVGYATISRFCTRLGFKGFLELKVSLLRSRDEGTVTPPGALEIVALQRYCHSLQRTQEALDMEAVQRVSDHIQNAQRVFFFGVGASFYSAQGGFVKFSRGISKAVSVPEGQSQLIAAATLTENDLAIVVSHSGATKTSVEIAHLAKSSGACVVVITHYAKSPIAEFADEVLLCGGEDRNINTMSLEDHVCIIYVLDVLYKHYAKQHPKQVQMNEALTANALFDKVF